MIDTAIISALQIIGLLNTIPLAVFALSVWWAGKRKNEQYLAYSILFISWSTNVILGGIGMEMPEM